jgi:hypothetical protein
MKKSKGRTAPGITYRLAPKRLSDQHCLPPGTVLIDQVFDRQLGRFRDFEPKDQVEGNFYLESEEGAAPPPDAPRRPSRSEAGDVVVQVFLTGDATANTSPRSDRSSSPSSTPPRSTSTCWTAGCCCRSDGPTSPPASTSTQGCCWGSS